MEQILSLWMCFVLVASSLVVLGDVDAEISTIELKGSGSDLTINTTYNVVGFETWNNVTVEGTGKLVVPGGATFNVTNIYLQTTSIIEINGGTVIISNPMRAANVVFNGTCSHFNVTNDSLIQMLGSNGYANTSSPGPYTAYIPVSKGGDAIINITATEELLIENSTINLTGGNGFDLLKSTILYTNTWSSGTNLGGYVAAGGNATVDLALTNNDTSLTINNTYLKAKGGDGGDAADGGNGGFWSPGKFGGYTNANVTGHVGSGGVASVKCDAHMVIITHSTVNVSGGQGGNAGDGGDTPVTDRGGGSGGGGYSGGNGGTYSGGAGASGGAVNGYVGAGGFAYLTITGNTVDIITGVLQAVGGNGGKAGNGGDGGYGFPNYGGGGGGGGGYSGGGGGACSKGKGGSGGNVSEFAGSGGNASLTIDSGYLKILNNSSFSSVAGNGGTEGVAGTNGYQDTTYFGGLGGKGNYSAMGGPGGGFVGWGSWGTSSLSGRVGFGGDAELNLVVSKCSVSSDTFVESNGGSGVLSGNDSIHIPMSVPLLLYPGNNSSFEDTPPTFEWLDLYDSTTNGLLQMYRIQIDDDINFTSPVDDHSTTSSTYNPPALPSGIYHWKAMAIYSTPSGSNNGWSETLNFNLCSLPMISSVIQSPPSPNRPGTVTFNISFSENMNQSVQPTVTFGTGPPYDSCSVVGNWMTSTEWVGVFDVTLSAIEGVQTLNVSDAKSTEDKIMVPYTAYSFLIDTSPPIVNAGPDPAKNSQFLQDAQVFDASSGIADYQWTKQSGPGTVTFGTPDAEDTQILADTEGTYVIRLTVTDNAGNLAYDEISLFWDSVGPVSQIDQCSQYWHSTDVVLNATANDAIEVMNVTLWYRYSADNLTWSAWIPFGTDSGAPWSWSFTFPDGQGYYEMYSIAYDTAGNIESIPTTTDAVCAFDSTAPEISDTSGESGTTGDPYSFNANITDNVNLSDAHVIYWFGAGNPINTTLANNNEINYYFTINIPLNSIDVLHYEIKSVDLAGNWNSTIIKDVPILDNDKPLANANSDQTVDAGSVITFIGSASSDNIGVSNYTWTFNDGVADVTIYGVSPMHMFTVSDIFTVNLTVRDSAGNSDMDVMTVSVNPPMDSDGDGALDVDDAFPDDPNEWQDADGDNIGDNGDSDDDGDGYLDEWEDFLGTDPLDPADMPPDTDTDGIPDGDAANSQTWMDTDDDGDDILDDEENPPAEEPGFLKQYWWLILIVVILAILAMLITLRRKPTAAESVETEPTPNTEPCPKCGFDIEKGTPCPFCAPEKPPEPAPEPPKKPETAPPKSGLSKDEMLQRVEKAYKEGKMSEEQYLKNLKKFSKP